MRKLTKVDINTLKKWGYSDEDIECIKYRLSYLRCYLYNYKDDTQKRISRKDAINYIGRDNFLSGLGRCAFHWHAGRGVENTSYEVSFDMSKYFKS